MTPTTSVDHTELGIGIEPKLAEALQRQRDDDDPVTMPSAAQITSPSLPVLKPEAIAEGSFEIDSSTETTNVSEVEPRPLGPKRPIGLATGPQPTLPDVGELLDEIRFLREQGLEDEAQQAIGEFATRFPEHPRLGEVRAAGEGVAPVKPRPSGLARKLQAAKGDEPSSASITEAPLPGVPAPQAASGSLPRPLEDLDDSEIDAALEDFGPEESRRFAADAKALEADRSPVDAPSRDPLASDEEIPIEEDDEVESDDAPIDVDQTSDGAIGGVTMTEGGTVVARLSDLLRPSGDSFDEPDFVDRTVITRGLQPPRPFAGEAPPDLSAMVPDGDAEPPTGVVPPKPGEQQPEAIEELEEVEDLEEIEEIDEVAELAEDFGDDDVDEPSSPSEPMTQAALPKGQPLPLSDLGDSSEPMTQAALPKGQPFPLGDSTGEPMTQAVLPKGQPLPLTDFGDSSEPMTQAALPKGQPFPMNDSEGSGEPMTQAALPKGQTLPPNEPEGTGEPMTQAALPKGQTLPPSEPPRGRTAPPTKSTTAPPDMADGPSVPRPYYGPPSPMPGPSGQEPAKGGTAPPIEPPRQASPVPPAAQSQTRDLFARRGRPPSAPSSLDDVPLLDDVLTEDEEEISVALEAPLEDREVEDAFEDVRGTEGTVIAVNPLAPAKIPEPIEPVRLEMIGARGQVVTEFTIEPGEVFVIGREPDKPWGDDEEMLAVHAEVIAAPGGGVIINDGEARGPVYRQLERREKIRDGERFRLGMSIITYHADPQAQFGVMRVQMNGEGPIQAVDVTEAGLMVGRDLGDIVLPADTYVSGDHCRVMADGHDLFIEDLGSSNGTFVLVRPTEPIEPGALLLFGQTQFRVERS